MGADALMSSNGRFPGAAVQVVEEVVRCERSGARNLLGQERKRLKTSRAGDGSWLQRFVPLSCEKPTV